MSKTKYLLRRSDVLIFLACIIASSFIFLNTTHRFNNLLLFLPAVYGCCYMFILAPTHIRTGSRTVFWFSVVEFIRLVFVPCYESVSEYVGFYGFKTEDIFLLGRSVLLMAYECVFVSIFLAFVLRKLTKQTEKEAKVEPLGNNKIALIFVLLLGILIYFTVSEVNRTLNFMMLASNSVKIRALTAGSKSSLAVGLITFTYDAFKCGFVLILDYAYRKYTLFGKNSYVFLAVFAGLITIGIINGESRSSIVYTLYAVMVCLGLCFKRYKKLITRIVALCGIMVLVGMTIYRLFAVYNYASYATALQERTLQANYIPSFIECYALGPQSVACGITFSDTMSGKFTVGTFFYDIFRPFMGLNVIAKLFKGNTSIEMYNSWMSGVEGKSNGIFLQISNQGYDYFGLLLAPLFACAFLWIAIYIEKKLKKTNTLFLVYFYNTVYIRMATCMIAGTMSGYITSITMTLIMCGVIYLLQKIVNSTVWKSKGPALG